LGREAAQRNEPSPAAPFQIVFTPTLEVFGGWPVGNCQRSQQLMGHEWRTVTVCN
jgi:hypothetical protein